MIKKSLLAVSIAASLAVVSAPSFAGYVCGTDSLTGYAMVENFVPTGVDKDGKPVFDGSFNATLSNLKGTVNCEVPPSGNYSVDVSGSISVDTGNGVWRTVSISSPLDIFSGALNLTGITAKTYSFGFPTGFPAMPFGFSVDYDGNTSAAVLGLINSLLGAAPPLTPIFGNTDGKGTLAVAGTITSDGATMTFTESNLNWVGFEALLFGADKFFDPNAYDKNPNNGGSYDKADANFAMTNVKVHVPEPTTLALLGLGLMGLGLARRRRAA